MRGPRLMMLAIVLASFSGQIGCEREPPPPEAPATSPAAANHTLLAPDVEPWVPASALGSDVVALLRIDMKRVEAADLHAALDALQWNQPALGESLANFERFRGAFTACGGQALVVAARFPDAPAGRDPGWRPMILLRVDPGIAPEDFATAIQETTQAPLTTRLSSYAPGWLAVEGEQLAPVPRDGQPDPEDPRLEPFAQATVPPVVLTFRVTPPLRQVLADRQALLAEILSRPLLQLTSGAAGLTPGSQPRLNLTLRFEDAEAAALFEHACRSLLGQATLQLNDPGQEVADAVGSLNFVREQARLALDVDPRLGRCMPRLIPVMVPALFRSVERGTSALADYAHSR